jgi:hypothetical protein
MSSQSEAAYQNCGSIAAQDTVSITGSAENQCWCCSAAKNKKTQKSDIRRAIEMAQEIGNDH